MNYNETFQQELGRLNPQQREAVEHIEGPVLVVAGPGTGKTQMLAARVGYILSTTDTQPQNILCLTYTEAGVIAMRERLAQFIGPDAYKVGIYTFHSFCNEIIQRHMDLFGMRELSPITELENMQLLRQMIDELPYGNILKRPKGDMYFEATRMNKLYRTMKEEDWSAVYVQEAIRDYLEDLPNREGFTYKRANKKQGIEVGDVKQHLVDKEAEKMEVLSAAAELYDTYNQKMAEMGRYDYSDMIRWVLQRFKTDEHFLRIYQERYLYFLVDEFQDTNGSQSEILELLTSYWDVPNVFAVGDDDQSIYEFQGARVRNIADFYQKYQPAIKLVVLRENYRSTQQILDIAGQLIDNNKERLINQPELPKELTKDLFAALPARKDSKVLTQLTEYQNPTYENAAIVEQIKRLQAAGRDLGEVAVIYRKHKQADAIIDHLEKEGIPYQTRKRIDILQEPLIEKLLTMLEFLSAEHLSPNSGEVYLFHMLYFDFFGINPRDVARLSAHMRHKKIVSWRDMLADAKTLEKMDLHDVHAIRDMEAAIVGLIPEIENNSLQLFLEKAINRSGLLDYVLHHPNKVWMLQLLHTFFGFVKEETRKRPDLSLSNLLDLLRQMLQDGIWLPINKVVEQSNGVNFLTAHGAKGLEFEYVYLMGCDKDSWEKSRGNYYQYSLPDTLTLSHEEDELESARRLFYVALTRAKEYLHISWPRENEDGKAREHSRFVEELTDTERTTHSPPAISDDKVVDFMGDSFKLFDEEIVLPEPELLDAMLKDYKLSASHLNKYLSCPVSFYYENVLSVPMAERPPLAFGNAVHEALRYLFKRAAADLSEPWPSVQDFTRAFERELYKRRDAFTQQEYDNHLNYGLELLPDYFNHYVGQWHRRVETEYFVFLAESDGVPLKGFIDKIEFYDGYVHVVDYKTGKVTNGKKKTNPPSEKDPNGGDYWRQIMFYKILLDNYPREHWIARSGEIDFIERNDKNEFTKVQISITPEHIGIVQAQIRDTYERIMRHEFSKGCGEADCYWCNFSRKHELIIDRKGQIQLGI